jgi:hypothetical protein
MAKHRSYAIEFKRQVAQEYLAGERLQGLPSGTRSAATWFGSFHTLRSHN